MKNLLGRINLKKTFLYVFSGLILLFILFVGATYFYYIDEISDPTRLVRHKNSGITFFDKDGSFLYAVEGTRNVDLINSENIPEDLKDATVAIEDNNFYNHKGVSIRGIGRSIVNNIKTLDASDSGGSTITQQLVKNTLLSQNKNIIRKLQEIILAPVVEKKHNKEEILQLYLSTVYYGEGAYGAEKAARIYFGKSLKGLGFAETALLAGLTPAPSVYSPFLNPELAKTRQELVLSKMLSFGFITQDQFDEAQKFKLVFAEKESKFPAPHFVLWLKDELEKTYGSNTLENKGLKVYTMLDRNLQNRAEIIVKSQVEQLKPYGATNAGLLTLDNETGGVLAMVGSADWFDDESDGKFNTVFAKRQPGSSFKPIVYLTAFQNGFTPATLLQDKLTEFEKGYTPTNFDEEYRGDVLARNALGSSINVPTVELGLKVGIDKILENARRLGITTLDKNAKYYGPNLALGGGEVRLIESTNVFATFARGGKFLPVTGIQRIVDKNDEVIFLSNPESKIVASVEHTFLITNILSDNEARADVFGRESLLKLSRPVAVKTGTTDDFKDSWTIGYSPSITTGVWVGNNNSEPMDYIAGAIGAAPIWNELMEFAFAIGPEENFKKPENIVTVKVCKNNGLLAEKNAKNTYLEYFVKGTTLIKTSDCK